MSKIGRLRALVGSGLYYLTEHADNEMNDDGFDVFDVEHAILAGTIRRVWPREGKYEIVGKSLDDRPIGAVCRMTGGGKVCVITVYEDNPKR